MQHAYQFDRVEGADALFVCSACNGIIGFNLPGLGEPAAIDNGDGTYRHPDNPEQWSGPCEPA